MSHDSVPLYFLYGEDEPIKELEFVHCEPLFIDMNRKNWEIAPHRHAALHQIFYLEHGELQASLDSQSVALKAPALLSIPADIVHGFTYNPEAEGVIVTIAVSYVRELLKESELPFVQQWLELPTICQFEEESAIASEASAYLQLIQRELLERAPAYVQKIGALIRLLLIVIDRGQIESRNLKSIQPDQLNLMGRFKSLLAQHYAEHWQVREYCLVLGVGERRFNRLCTSLTGRSAKQLIQERLIQEAKQRLVYTGAPITQVCYELGFKDPAYFSRFFRRATGASPKQFTRMHRLDN